MATLNSVVTGALKKAGLVGLGQTAPAYLIADALHATNLMLDLWSSQGIYYPSRETLAIVAGTASYTIGTGGVFNTSRPNRLLDSHILVGSQEYPLAPIDHSKYESISDKTITGRPRFMHMVPTMPLGVLKVHPVPDVNYSLILVSLKPMPTFDPGDLTTSANLPPGYDIAIEYNLAVMLAGDNGRQLPQSTYGIAGTSYNSIVNQCAAYRVKNMIGLDPTGQSGNDFPVGWFG